MPRSNRKRVVCIILAGMLVLTGCESNQSSHADSETSTAPQDNTIQRKTNLYTLNKIEGILQEDKTVSHVIESPDKKAVAYMVSDTGSEEEPMTLHVWSVGDNKPRSATGSPETMVGDVFWSPDSEYVFVDSGTFVTRSGELYSVRTLEVEGTFDYVQQAYFSPNSKYIVYSTGSDPLSAVKTVKGDYLDPSEAFDLVLYEMETRQSTVLLNGTETQDYMASGWLDEHTLLYQVTTYSVENNDLQEREATYAYDFINRQIVADPTKISPMTDEQ